MRPLIPLTTFVFSVFLALSAQAQSLADDAKALVAATRVLEEKGYNLQDSAAVEAFSTMMAILYEYDNPTSPDSFSNSQLGKLPNRYRENPGIPELVNLDSISLLLDTVNTGFVTQFRWHSGALRLAPRQKMVDLLRGDYGSSPAEYLSVSRALRRYSVPPVESIQTLEVLAGESNQNVQNGIVNTQALIQGLFQFVLKRAQEEVVINFMERFLREEVVSYQDLFPTVVEQFNTPGFSYSHSFIERVREAFFEDLQLMSVRLPTIVLNEDRFQKLQEDPFIYNLLAIYSIVGMAQNQVPIDEIMPITHRNLFENYKETEKKLNFIIAEFTGRSTEYDQLVELARSCVNRVKTIYLGLEQGESEIVSDIEQIVADHPDNIPAPEFAYLLKPAYNLDVVMGNDTTAGFRLNLLPYLLQGRLDTAYLLGFRNVGAYDKFFGTERSPEQWKAAGLDLARSLNGTWYNDYSISQILRNWTTDLTLYRLEYEKWKRELFPDIELAIAFEKLETGRVALADAISETRTYWEPVLEGTQGLAFDMLSAIISDTWDPTDIQVMVEIAAMGEEQFLENGLKKLIDVEERLIQLNDKIGEANPGPQAGNPLHAYLFSKNSPHPYAAVFAQIDELSNDLDALEKQFDILDRQLAPREVQLMDNARPLLWLTESMTHLLYCLRTGDPQDKWITKAELDSILNVQELRDAFLGLLYQRMSQVQEASLISPEGLAQLVQLTVGDLTLLLTPLQMDSTLEDQKVDFFNTASFLVNTLNRTLEIPLIVDPDSSGLILPLSERIPALRDVPEISELVLDMIYYLNVGDHRHAISSAIRLFIMLEQFAVGDSIHEFLEQYGFFIADLVDADTAEEVESLLNGIADPPGSSRLKRNKNLTVGLNAYLGATFGRESWTGPSLANDDIFYSPAPTMPIGVALSEMIGRRSNNPQSFSVFLSFLDLGSILAYRGDPAAIGQEKLTFKNMFKPSVQIHWNIQNSPFYLGYGVQTGPVYRELGGDEFSLRSTRMFLSFGVDVPIKTFYTR